MLAEGLVDWWWIVWEVRRASDIIGMVQGERGTRSSPVHFEVHICHRSGEKRSDGSW